ncbi:MAG: hypothetical protein V4601_11495 [Pseudomonadota bacterium]
MLACAVLLAFQGMAAGAQPVSRADSVTVTSQKSREIINAFVTSLTAPARLTGKLGRWDVGICPTVIGVRPEAVRFVIQRVRDTAARIGAPVNADASCRPNIHIVFTTTPQALLTNIRNNHSQLLGYADSAANKARLATVTLPIQAWYFTQTRDNRGKTLFDVPNGVVGEGREIIGLPLPHAQGAVAVTSGRLGDSTRTVFYNLLIVADPNALLDHEMGTVADHVAMLALAQTEPLKDCPTLPSILNLFTPGCATRPIGMTPADEGYLRGLYSMDARAFLQTQRDQMVRKIGQTIEGR